MTEHVLSYDAAVVPQETPWDCGPASAQVVLNGRGIIRSETDLISLIGTTQDGTADVGLVAAVLCQLLPDANYLPVFFDNEDLPTQQQKDQLWVDITHSIDCGYGVVMNWDAPPSNYPIGVKGSPNPDYGGGEVMHYVPCMGYDDAPGGRALWIADPGFSPFGYWISFEQAATLIPPKGYTYADAATVAPPVPVPAPEAPVTTDTLFADVSEFQAPVDDSYPYPVLSIRVSDGSYMDRNFGANYAWMRAALDSGRLAFGIVYTYVRPGTWQSNAATVKQMIDSAGGVHPRVALMLDVESGGNPGGDQSAPINALHDTLADYAGSPARIIGYANSFDFSKMWPSRPAGLRVIGAGYGSNPNLPGQVAHQYTDGTGFSPNLPQGCPPFGNCDMNSADGLDAAAFAAACGITSTPTPPTPPKPAPTPEGPLMAALTDDEQQELLTKVRDIWDQLRGPDGHGWPELGPRADGNGNRTPVDALAHQLGNPDA